VDVHFFFVAKKKRTKEKTRGCVVSLLKVVLWQGLWFPQHANAALGS
jgi:hypothetical protein